MGGFQATRGPMFSIDRTSWMVFWLPATSALLTT